MIDSDPRDFASRDHRGGDREMPEGAAPGTVHLRVTVDTEGSVCAVEVLDWPERPGLVVPAIRAARQWKFKPATRDGCAVADDQIIDIVFTPSH